MKRKGNFSRLVIFAIAAFVALSVVSTVQAAYVEIGTGTSYEWHIPAYGGYNYGWSATLYNQSEIGSAITIEKIAYYVDHYGSGNSYTFYNQKCYMGHTTASTFSDGSRPDPSTMTLVYDGDVTWSGTGWNSITLDTPFSYNGVDNLVIYWENWDGDYDSGYPYWQYTSQTNRAKYYYNDYNDPDDPGSATGYLCSYVPNIRLYYPNANDVGVTAINEPTGTIIQGTQTIKVQVENFGTNDQSAVPVVGKVYQIDETVLLDENMDADPGWSTTGCWEFGEPTSGPGSAHTGTNVYATNLSGDYPLYADDNLTMPTIDLTAYDEATLDYWFWYDTESTTYDGIVFQISVDSGAFTDVITYGGHSQGYWENIIFDLTPYCGHTIQIRWHMYSDISVCYPGGYIDDVKVIGRTYSLVHTCSGLTSLNSGESKEVTLSPDWSATPGDYLIKSYTTLSGDEDNSNNASSTLVTVLAGIHDVGVNSVDYPPSGMVPAMSFNPKATVENYGDFDETNVPIECWIYKHPQTVFTEDFESLTAPSQSGSVNIISSIIKDKGEDEKFGEAQFTVEYGSTPPGAVSDWTIYGNWHQTSYRYSSPTHSMYNGDDISHQYPSYASDWLISPQINVGTSGGTLDFDLWMYCEGSYYDNIYFGNSADGNSWSFWWFGGWGGPTGGFIHVSVPLFTSQIDPDGNTYVGFYFSSDSVVQYEGCYVDDVTVSKSGGVVYDEWIYEDLDMSQVKQVVFPSFTPECESLYDVHVCTWLLTDTNPSNDCQAVYNVDASGRVYNVDKDQWYRTFQDAIDDADPYDTLQALPYTYEENINVNVEGLTLETYPTAIPAVTIDGGGTAPCITINADYITINGFEIVNGLNGIMAQSSGVTGCTISQCEIHDNINPSGYAGAGIMFYGYDGGFFNNVIENNEIYNNARQGIFLGWFYGAGDPVISTENIITGNEIYNNGLDETHPPDASCYGIQLTWADYNSIEGNTIYDHSWLYGGTTPWGAGIYLWASFNNYVTGNYIYNNDEGVRIWNDASGRTLGPNCVNYNYFGKWCQPPGVAIVNYDAGNTVDARWNWYGQDDGPAGLTPDAVTGRIADGFGDQVFGDLWFDPWIGVDAEILTDHIAVLDGEVIHFDGTTSFNVDTGGNYVDNLEYEWDLGDGQKMFIEEFAHLYDSPGTYTVQLHVRAPDLEDIDVDNPTLDDFATIHVTVTARGQPLKGFADPEIVNGEILDQGDGYSGIVKIPLQFEALATGGTPDYTFEWDFGDGTTTTSRTPIHVYENTGEYLVTLTVTDSEGQTVTDTTTAVIKEKETPEPVTITDVTGGFGLTATVINPTGEPIPWSIHVEGKLVFYGDHSCTLEGETGTISTKVLGFGKATITITADQTIEEYSAFLLGPFVLGLRAI